MSIRLLSTLRVLEGCTFMKCRDLRAVEFSESLAEVGPGAFFESGIEHVVLPASVRTVGGWAFASCERLRDVRLNEGLEALG